MRVNWNFPLPRAGYKGLIDKSIGPGATKDEKNLQLFVPLLAGLALIGVAYFGRYSWSWSQYLVAYVLAVDMVGGIITNSTSSAKRWFHREGRGVKQHLGFVAIHFAQLALFSWVFLGSDLWWVFITGSYMMISAGIILKTSLHMRRPVALSLYALSVVLTSHYLDSAPGLEWFLPLFYLKLLVCHLLKEAPFRPQMNANS
ncbi:hypothetical protein DBZ36_18095 [Alginatibacterium sediminis]|uniref:Uncharacterized protein n=1 Tax=Alginatibacterium sediminis TaxID=2164068 RepID=A0A420E6W0_9ALTE|nr:hypothetical protein [Alginatibacterium sediminis]RKF13684.1 hypothetical protein DBZ36_18095 [Alginatibacterium sediminis]